MFDYFDYIYESSQEDIDDIDSIYNETDLTVAEFDLYVQEGVGLNILIGVGIAALIGLLIGVIVKLVSGGGGSSVSSSISQAQKKIELAKKYGVEKVKFRGFLGGEGWLSEDDMKLFDIIKSESEAGVEVFKDIINILEKFAKKSIDKPTEDLINNIGDILVKHSERLAEILGTLGSIPGMSKEKYINLKPSDIGMKGDRFLKEYGEEGEIEIVEFDKRLKDLKEYQKSFNLLGSQLKELHKQAEDFEKKNPQLINAMQKYIGDLKQNILDQSNAAIAAGAAMKKSADSISKAIDKTMKYNEVMRGLGGF